VGTRSPSLPASQAHNLGLFTIGRELPVIQIVYFLQLLGKFDAGGADATQVSS